MDKGVCYVISNVHNPLFISTVYICMYFFLFLCWLRARWFCTVYMYILNQMRWYVMSFLFRQFFHRHSIAPFSECIQVKSFSINFWHRQHVINAHNSNNNKRNMIVCIAAFTAHPKQSLEGVFFLSYSISYNNIEYCC